MKQQFNARISAITRNKLDALTALHGSQSEVLAVAIDRLYQAEISTGVAHVDGTFDFAAMREVYARRIDEADQSQARSEILAAIQAHVAATLPDESPEYQREQVRLAANGVFANFGHRSVTKDDLI